MHIIQPEGDVSSHLRGRYIHRGAVMSAEDIEFGV